MSDFAATSPAQVTVVTFIESQVGLPWYSWLNQRMVFFELGAFFLLVAILLYCFVFFLISVMEDIGSQTGVYYVDGSSSLETEKQRVKKVLSLFGGSYILRSGFDLTIAIYLTEYVTFRAEYPGFTELAQSLYFLLSDIVPIASFFWMHHTLYGDQNRERVQMRVDADHPH